MILYRLNWIVDRPNADGLCSVRLRVKWCRSKCVATFSLPYKIETSKWIQSAQRVKPNTSHGKNAVSAADINRRIGEYEQMVADIFAECDDVPTVGWFRNEFENRIYGIKTESESICELIDRYIAAQSVVCGWSRATFVKFRTLRSHFEMFNDRLAIDGLTADHLRSFTRFLIERGYRNSYTAKMYDFLKTVLLWAKANGDLTSAALDTFKLRLKASENKEAVVYLTWSELMRLYECQFPRESLDRVRDVFCFCCFTGLRYSDVKKLRRADIHTDYIQVVTQKTTDALKIELNDYSRAILQKYATESPAAYALPVLSNVKYNERLKEVGRIAGLTDSVKKVWYVGSERHESDQPKWQLLTSHVARRTFVVNALSLGISAEVIMKWTGHSDYDSMKPYIAIVDDLKAGEMSKFNRH